MPTIVPFLEGEKIEYRGNPIGLGEIFGLEVGRIYTVDRVILPRKLGGTVKITLENLPPILYNTGAFIKSRQLSLPF